MALTRSYTADKAGGMGTEEKSEAAAQVIAVTPLAADKLRRILKIVDDRLGTAETKVLRGRIIWRHSGGGAAYDLSLSLGVHEDNDAVVVGDDDRAVLVVRAADLSDLPPSTLDTSPAMDDTRFSLNKRSAVH